jgi:hypothetical protein
MLKKLGAAAPSRFYIVACGLLSVRPVAGESSPDHRKQNTEWLYQKFADSISHSTPQIDIAPFEREQMEPDTSRLGICWFRDV